MGKPFMTEEFNNIDKTKLSSEMLISEIRNKLCIGQIQEFESPEHDFAVKDLFWKYFFSLEETSSGYRVGIEKKATTASLCMFVLGCLAGGFLVLIFGLFAFMRQYKLKKLVAGARTNISEVYSLSSFNQTSSKLDELSKLKDLRDQGVLSEKEFEVEKKAVLAKAS